MNGGKAAREDPCGVKMIGEKFIEIEAYPEGHTYPKGHTYPEGHTQHATLVFARIGAEALGGIGRRGHRPDHHWFVGHGQQPVREISGRIIC